MVSRDLPDGETWVCRRCELRAMNPEERELRRLLRSRETARRRRAANPEIGRASAARRRALELSTFVEDVALAALFDRDRGRCGVCGEEVERALKHPDPKSASVDHVVPLSKGGEHSYANTQLAHLDCNRRKGTKVMGELRLAG